MGGLERWAEDDKEDDGDVEDERDEGGDEEEH